VLLSAAPAFSQTQPDEIEETPFPILTDSLNILAADGLDGQYYHHHRIAWPPPGGATMDTDSLYLLDDEVVYLKTRGDTIHVYHIDDWINAVGKYVNADVCPTGTLTVTTTDVAITNPDAESSTALPGLFQNAGDQPWQSIRLTDGNSANINGGAIRVYNAAGQTWFSNNTSKMFVIRAANYGMYQQFSTNWDDTKRYKLSYDIGYTSNGPTSTAQPSYEAKLMSGGAIGGTVVASMNSTNAPPMDQVMTTYSIDISGPAITPVDGTPIELYIHLVGGPDIWIDNISIEELEGTISPTVSAGTVTAFDATNKIDEAITFASSSSFDYYIGTTLDASGVTTVDLDHYDLGGVKTPLTPASSAYDLVWILPSTGATYIQYGTQEYTTVSRAKAEGYLQPMIPPVTGAILSGAIVRRSVATELDEYFFICADRFGQLASVASEALELDPNIATGTDDQHLVYTDSTIVGIESGNNIDLAPLADITYVNNDPDDGLDTLLNISGDVIPLEDNHLGTHDQTLTGNRTVDMNMLDLTFSDAASGRSLSFEDEARIVPTGNNFFVGSGTGNVDLTGTNNSFFGNNTGRSTTSGASNLFSGSSSGRENTTGASNLFVGSLSGFRNISGSNNAFVGNNTGLDNTIGGSNLFIGSSSGRNNTVGSSNAFIGNLSGFSNTSGSSNLFSGNSTGRNNTTGGSNAFIGNLSGFSNTTGSSNLFVGSSAGNSNTTGSSNAFIGSSAGEENTVGIANLFIGTNTGRLNISGGSNAFIGNAAGMNNTTGNSNLFVGSSSGFGNSTGSDNAFIGSSTGRTNSSGSSNLFVGSLTGFRNTTGSSNAFIGNRAGLDNTTGSSNLFIGSNAGRVNVSGGSNAFIGNLSGFSNTTGNSNLFAGNSSGRENISGSSNAFIGASSGFSNTTGSSNLFVGSSSGRTNTVGSSNAFIGNFSGFSNTTGSSNLFVGVSAGSDNISGGSNAFIGNASGISNTTGSSNLFVGIFSGVSNTEGSSNAFVGNAAGRSNTVGSSNVFIGSDAGIFWNAESNVAIGHNAGATFIPLSTKNVTAQIIASNEITVVGHGLVGNNVPLLWRATTPGSLLDNAIYFFDVIDGNTLLSQTPFSISGSGSVTITDMDQSAITEAVALGFNAKFNGSRTATIGATTNTDIILNGQIWTQTNGGQLTFRDYGVGSFLDPAPAYLLGVQADGDVVEVDPSGLGSSVHPDSIFLGMCVTADSLGLELIYSSYRDTIHLVGDDTPVVVDTDDQQIDKLNLNGTTLEISLQDDGVPDETVDLSSLQDGTGTDDQTGAEVSLVTTGFNNNLASTDNTVQKLADKVDDLDLSGQEISISSGFIIGQQFNNSTTHSVASFLNTNTSNLQVTNTGFTCVAAGTIVFNITLSMDGNGNEEIITGVSSGGSFAGGSNRVAHPHLSMVSLSNAVNCTAGQSFTIVSQFADGSGVGNIENGGRFNITHYK